MRQGDLSLPLSEVDKQGGSGSLQARGLMCAKAPVRERLASPGNPCVWLEGFMLVGE